MFVRHIEEDGGIYREREREEEKSGRESVGRKGSGLERQGGSGMERQEGRGGRVRNKEGKERKWKEEIGSKTVQGRTEERYMEERGGRRRRMGPEEAEEKGRDGCRY